MRAKPAIAQLILTGDQALASLTRAPQMATIRFQSRHVLIL